MAGKYGKMGMPKKKEEEMDLDMELDMPAGEGEDMEMPEGVDLSELSDDELLAELSSRGLMPDEDEEMDYSEEDMGEESDDLDDEDLALA